MRERLLAVSLALFVIGFIAVAHAQLMQTGVGHGPAGGGGGGGCAQATALIARMDGGQNTSAVTTAVCGMVTDGVFALLDFLYVGEINSVGNSKLNWVSLATH